MSIFSNIFSNSEEEDTELDPQVVDELVLDEEDAVDPDREYHLQDDVEEEVPNG